MADEVVKDYPVEVKPSELIFDVPGKGPVATKLRIFNGGDKLIAFKVKTTAPKRYCVRPNNGLIQPGQSFPLQVILLQNQKEDFSDLEIAARKDKFQVLACVAELSTSPEDVQTLPQFAKPEFQQKIRCKFVRIGQSGSFSSPNAVLKPETELNDVLKENIHQNSGTVLSDDFSTAAITPVKYAKGTPVHNNFRPPRLVDADTPDASTVRQMQTTLDEPDAPASSTPESSSWRPSQDVRAVTPVTVNKSEPSSISFSQKLQDMSDKEVEASNRRHHAAPGNSEGATGKDYQNELIETLCQMVSLTAERDKLKGALEQAAKGIEDLKAEAESLRQQFVQQEEQRQQQQASPSTVPSSSSSASPGTASPSQQAPTLSAVGSSSGPNAEATKDNRIFSLFHMFLVAVLFFFLGAWYS